MPPVVTNVRVAGPSRRSAYRCALIVASLLAPDARAQPTTETPLALAFDVQTPPACPREGFLRALSTRARRPFEVRSESEVTLQITVTSADDGFQAAAAFAGGSGRAERTVRGSCEEITAALALVSATWIESEPIAPIRAHGSGSEGVSSDDPHETPPDRVEPPPDPVSHAWVGAQGFGGFGIFGNPAPGVGLYGAYERGRIEVRLGVRGSLANDQITLGDMRFKASYRWLLAPIDGCLHTMTKLRVGGCARIEPGFLDANYAGRDMPLPWLMVGAGARLGGRAGAVRLELEAFAMSTATGYRLSPAGATLVPFRSIAVVTAAGIALPIW